MDCPNVLRTSSALCRPWSSFGYGTVPPPGKLVTLLCQACCLDDALVFPQGMPPCREVACRLLQVQCQKASMDAVFSCPAISAEGCLLIAGGITVSRNCVVVLLARGAIVLAL